MPDDREARARGLIDTLEEETCDVDHVIVQVVVGIRRNGLKEGEVAYTQANGTPHKIFHPLDANLDRLATEAVREVGRRRQQQAEEQ